MKRILVVTLLALLAFPVSAQAKELAWAKVCGAAGCTEIKRPSMELTGGGDGIWDRAPTAGPWYSVELHVREGDRAAGHWTVWFASESRMLALRNEAGLLVWDRVEPDALSAFRAVTAGIEPFPADARGAPPFARTQQDGTAKSLAMAAPGFLVAIGVAGAVAFVRRRRSG